MSNGSEWGAGAVRADLSKGKVPGRIKARRADLGAVLRDGDGTALVCAKI